MVRITKSDNKFCIYQFNARTLKIAISLKVLLKIRKKSVQSFWENQPLNFTVVCELAKHDLKPK